MPSYHVPLLASAAIRAGEHVVHVGAGVGYYSAILARLVGSTGRVTAIVFDAALVQRTKENFSAAANVVVLQGDGAAIAFDGADVIYVSAGATRPVDVWLDRLNDGGRLILLLTAKKTLPPGGGPIARHGAVFRIERRGDDYLAKWIAAVGVYPCEVTTSPKPPSTQPYKKAVGNRSHDFTAPAIFRLIAAGCVHRAGRSLTIRLIGPRRRVRCVPPRPAPGIAVIYPLAIAGGAGLGLRRWSSLMSMMRRS
jgi:SAM-dependent methyltransferase